MSDAAGQKTGISSQVLCTNISVDLTTLSVQQLSEVKKQFDEGNLSTTQVLLKS